MRLIYAYIESYRNYSNQGINFVDDFHCSFENKTLYVEKRPQDEIKQLIYRGSILRDLVVVVGETGSGKTNLFQLIGMGDDFRADLRKTDSYMLVFVDDNTKKYIIELCNCFPKNIDLDLNDFDKKYGFTGTYTFQTNEDGRLVNVERLGRVVESDTYIVNCFDLNSFSSAPCHDIHREGILGSEYIPRLVSPFGRTNLGIACEMLYRYVKDLTASNIKRKCALRIKAFNWSDKMPIDLDEDILKQHYWTYRDKRYDFIKQKNHPIKQTPKFQFLHDLLTDFALYLRKWAESEYNHTNEDLLEGLMEGIISPTPSVVVPDVFGGGGMIEEILRRIEWLGSYIDSHFDEMMGEQGLVWQITSDIKDLYEILNQFDEKYFTETEFTLPIMDMNFDSKPISDLFERMTAYRPDDYGIFTKELLPYEIIGVSSGEYQYAKTLGAIDEYCIRMKVSAGRNRKTFVKPNFILLLDEPEAYMHPELCRQFIYRMNEILSKDSEKSSIQILLTTHSPFLLSDVTSGQVIRLQSDQDGYCRVLPKEESSTFAAGVHSIMAKEFFLTYTIGEYSRQYVTGLINRLKAIKSLKSNLDDNNRKFICEARIVSSYIGDRVIRAYLEDLIAELE